MKSNVAAARHAPNSSQTAHQRARELLYTLAKLAIGGGLLYWVFRSGMVDVRALGDHLKDPRNAAVGFGFMLLSVSACATRWYFLARPQGLSLSPWMMFELTMIGNFFNTFMPGSVGGDVIKAWYVAGREPKKRTRAVFTVLLDRIIGLSVILLYSAVTLLFYSSWLAARPELRWIATFLWAFTLGCILASVFFFTPGLWRVQLFRRLLDLLHRWGTTSRIVDAALEYRQRPRVILLALLLSAVSMLGATLMYKYQGDRLGIPMDLAHYFFVVPVGLTASAIPILPGGLGVGQVAFYTLFLWTGVPNPETGGSLCTAVQLYTILFNCLGAIFYVRFRKLPAREHLGPSLS